MPVAYAANIKRHFLGAIKAPLYLRVYLTLQSKNNLPSQSINGAGITELCSEERPSYIDSAIKYFVFYHGP